MDSLPDELLLAIYRYCGNQELLNLEGPLGRVAKDKSLWRDRIVKEIPHQLGVPIFSLEINAPLKNYELQRFNGTLYSENCLNTLVLFHLIATTTRNMEILRDKVRNLEDLELYAFAHKMRTSAEIETLIAVLDKRLFEGILTLLDGCPDLKRLRIQEVSLTSFELLSFLEKLPKLEILEIEFCANLIYNDYIVIRDMCPHLQRCYIENVGMLFV